MDTKMIRVKIAFHSWLRLEAVRRECSIAELVEQLAEAAEGGRPWARRRKKK